MDSNYFYAAFLVFRERNALIEAILKILGVTIFEVVEAGNLGLKKRVNIIFTVIQLLYGPVSIKNKLKLRNVSEFHLLRVKMC